MTCTIVSDGAELLLKCKNEHEPPYPAVKEQLRDAIWELCCKGFNKFYLNCEYGIPLWTAEIICAFKMYNDIELHIVMPYEEQSVNWSEEHRDRYYNIHAQSDSIVIANTRYHSDCYNDADKIMLDESDALVAFGNLQNKIYAAQYAEANGIDIKYCELYLYF